MDEASHNPEWTANFLRVLRAKSPGSADLVAMRLRAIEDMLHYTEGAGRDEIHDRIFWTRARLYDLKTFPGLVAAIREGREPTMAELFPSSGGRPRGIPSPITPGPAISESDAAEARDRYEREKGRLRQLTLANQTQREITRVIDEGFDDGYREPGEDDS